MKWLDAYKQKRREARERRDEIEKQALKEMHEQRVLEAKIKAIPRFPGSLDEFNTLTGIEYELMDPGTRDKTIHMGNPFYHPSETDGPVFEGQNAHLYRVLLNNGWAAVVRYDKRSREGLPVKPKSYSR